MGVKKQTLSEDLPEISDDESVDQDGSEGGESSALPDIFAYREYRPFLKDLFSGLKKNEKGFSIRKLANKAGISVGYISNIINTDQRISNKVWEKLLPHLPLTPAARSYLKLLCAINDSDSQVERLEALKRLQKFKPYLKAHSQEAMVYKYFTRWYCVAIRELASIEGFKADPKWIQERLRFQVPLAEIAKTFDFLLENGLISKRDDGSYSSTDQRIICEGNAFSTALTQFHKQIFQLAAESIDIVPKEERNIRGHTFPISVENFDKMKEILDEALEKMAKLSSQDQHPNGVYHFSFVGFPMTQAGGGGDQGKRDEVQGIDQGNDQSTDKNTEQSDDPRNDQGNSGEDE